jgi:ankyrin repeat protein
MVNIILEVPQVFVYNSLHKLDSFFNRRTKGKSSAEAIKTLIADGKLDPNEPANTNSSILALAVQSGDSESVRVLLEHGASDDGSEAGMYGSILTISAIWGNMEAFNLLVDHGATVQESAAFHEAVYHTRYDMVKILLDRGSNPNAKMPRSYTEGLVKHGKSYGGLWRPDHGQPRPLHIAVWRAANMAKKEKKSPPRKDSLSMISLLIARGANLNLGDDQGRTPLDILKEGDDRDVVEILWTALMPGTSRGRLS